VELHFLLQLVNFYPSIFVVEYFNHRYCLLLQAFDAVSNPVVFDERATLMNTIVPRPSEK
jgi:hypothetical protein